jgi:hypothetical protein
MSPNGQSTAAKTVGPLSPSIYTAKGKPLDWRLLRGAPDYVTLNAAPDLARRLTFPKDEQSKNSAKSSAFPLLDLTRAEGAQLKFSIFERHFVCPPLAEPSPDRV